MPQVGLDVAEHVSPILVQGLGDRFRSDNFGLTGKMVKAGLSHRNHGEFTLSSALFSVVVVVVVVESFP
mgnify:CR=1 FL=1